MKAAKKINGEISSMNLFVISFISVTLLYVLTLPFVGQRAKKAHTEEIDELKKQIAVNKSMINHLERAIKKQQGIRH